MVTPVTLIPAALTPLADTEARAGGERAPRDRGQLVCLPETVAAGGRCRRRCAARTNAVRPHAVNWTGSSFIFNALIRAFSRHPRNTLRLHC